MKQVHSYRHYNETKNANALKLYEAQAYRTYDVLEGKLTKIGGESILPGRLSALDAQFYPWVY